MFLLTLLAAGAYASSLGDVFEATLEGRGRGRRKGTLFGNAFGSPETASELDLSKTCSPYITFNPLDRNLSGAARKALLGGTLIANDKSKGSGWLIQLGIRKSIRYDTPFSGGNHETAVSFDGKHIAVPHYETPTFNSTEGGGAGPSAGHSVSIVEIHTGRAEVLPMRPLLDTFALAPKPHDAQYLPNGDLLITAQIDNSIAKISAASGNVTAFRLKEVGCSTPHLVRVIPSKAKNGNPRFAVTGCRGSNADTPKDYVGHLAVIDLVTNKLIALETPGGRWDEGITVTNEGEVWVGSLNEHIITIFGWPAATKERTLDTIEIVKKLTLKYPLRFAYDEVSDRVAVATINLAAVLQGDTSDSGLHVYNSKTKTLIKSMQLTTERGVINSEGLRNGPGFFFTGGFDTQAMVVVDAKSLEQVAEILVPRCTMPIGQCVPVSYMPNNPPTMNGITNAATAKARGYSGWNNWSGGLCQATDRNPFDRRFATLDGFNYSPVYPAWASL